MSTKFELESNENIVSWKKLYNDIFENELVVDLNELFLKKPKNEINAQVIRIYGD
ncbi:2942_t:CDS:2, partial [Gigaspora rosea]